AQGGGQDTNAIPLPVKRSDGSRVFFLVSHGAVASTKTEASRNGNRVSLEPARRHVRFALTRTGGGIPFRWSYRVAAENPSATACCSSRKKTRWSGRILRAVAESRGWKWRVVVQPTRPIRISCAQ